MSDSLFDNRMTEKTLNAMWSAVNKYKHPFTAYLDEKAKLYGDNKMKSYNFWAPIGDSNQSLTYDDAVDFILEQFSSFGDESESFLNKHFMKAGLRLRIGQINLQLHFVQASLVLVNLEFL